jgi:hypothetical protein
MSAPTNNGGPAFPSVGEGFGNPSYSAPGMTLRDYFAGQALAGMFADRERLSTNAQHFSHDAYLFADAMLAAREGKK